MSTLWMQFERDTRLKLMMFFSDLSFDEQSDLFARLRHCLNKDMCIQLQQIMIKSPPISILMILNLQTNLTFMKAVTGD